MLACSCRESSVLRRVLLGAVILKPMCLLVGLWPCALMLSHVANMSITVMNRIGLSTSPCATPHCSVQLVVVPSVVTILRDDAVLRLLISLWNFAGYFILFMAMSLAQNSRRSNACVKSRKVWCISLPCFRAVACANSTSLSGSKIVLPGRNAYWFGQ